MFHRWKRERDGGDQKTRGLLGDAVGAPAHRRTRGTLSRMDRWTYALCALLLAAAALHAPGWALGAVIVFGLSGLISSFVRALYAPRGGDKKEDQ